MVFAVENANGHNEMITKQKILLVPKYISITRSLNDKSLRINCIRKK